MKKKQLYARLVSLAYNCFLCLLVFFNCCCNELCRVSQLLLRVAAHEGYAQACGALGYGRIANSGHKNALVKQLFRNLEGGSFITDNNGDDGGGGLGLYPFLLQAVDKVLCVVLQCLSTLGLAL